jgi:hypothetical protein
MSESHPDQAYGQRRGTGRSGNRAVVMVASRTRFNHAPTLRGPDDIPCHAFAPSAWAAMFERGVVLREFSKIWPDAP